MTFKEQNWSVLLRVLLLLAVLLGLSYGLLRGWWLLAGICALAALLQTFSFYRFHLKAQKEVAEFAESVHYRDFTRYFSLKRAPVELRTLRKGLNEINSELQVISREKEMQYQYLQKILEMVDTGILSYDRDNGLVTWMNDAFKKLLGIPYLKTIHSLEKRNPDLYRQLRALRTGDSRVVTVRQEHMALKLLLTTTAFQTEGRVYTLVAFQNVNEALDETESQAWQKLLSVMTHEIMNSVAPISSLAGTLKKRLQHGGGSRDEGLDDLEMGIETIQRRSEGLLKFAETYRNLNKISRPQCTRILVRDVFEHLHQLMQPTLQQKKIDMEIILRDPSQALLIDINLVEQVLINLVVNAMEAVKDVAEPRITLVGAYENQKPVLSVVDNGTGIPPELLDKIFIPFFSTRKSGNGIGLSLCKQIMMLHQGNIQVHTEPGRGTAFRLQFNA